MLTDMKRNVQRKKKPRLNSMDKRKVATKQFLVYLVALSSVINYCLFLLGIALTINPFMALAILFFTVAIAYVYARRFYDALAENL